MISILKPPEISLEVSIPKKGIATTIISFIREKPLGAAGAIVFLIAILIAILAPWISPYDPNTTDYIIRLQLPSAQHWLGTDELGRDVLSRVLWGARVSMFIGVTSTLLGTVIGAIIGIISGYAGGKTDMVIQRIMDILMAFPPLVLILAIMAALGPSVYNTMFALIIPITAPANRVSRSVTLSVKEFQFIEAVKALGARPIRVAFQHVLPNTMASYLIIVSSMVGAVILAEASLSFLGMGVPPPNPSWGRSLNEGMSWLYSAPLLSIWPGLAISLVVFGVNVFGDALRDFLDPRLKRL